MATAPELVDSPPAGMAGWRNDELAEIIPLNPSPDERDLSYQDLARSVPGRLLRGLGHAAGSARDFAWNQLTPGLGDDMEILTIPHNHYDHMVLTIGPDPETGVKRSEAPKIWLGGGLTELADVGSFRVAPSDRRAQSRE